MDRYTVAGIDISLEALPAGRFALGEGVQRYRVCNCEWQAELALLPRAHGELGYSVEVTPLHCVGNRAKIAHDLPCIQPLFARLVPRPGACLVVAHPLTESA